MRKRNSTKTLRKDGVIVPWLAAEGALSYSADQPTIDRYLFQYGWHLPHAFKDRHAHHYFGRSSSFIENSGTEAVLRSFWQSAVERTHHKIFEFFGKRSENGFLAPIACFDLRGDYSFNSGYLLIQQGCYQRLPRCIQPLVQDGILHICRGIGKDTMFRLMTVPGDHQVSSLDCYWRAMEQSFYDSEVAFQVAHSFVKRSETGYLSDNLNWHDVSRQCGIDVSDDALESRLARFHSESFGLSEELVATKFGPNYVKFSTPATNVRLTSFFAGEYEVNVIDPRLLTVVEVHGCEVANGSGRS